jgi:4-carboxymuconolactone decarboxylase
MLLHSPQVAAKVGELGHYLRFDSVLSDADRELAILTAARESNAAIEWAGHVRLGLRVGVRQEAIDAIANRSDLNAFTPEEAVIVDYGRQILREKRVSHQTFDAAHKRFGDRGIVDLTALLGYYTMIACTLNAFEMMPAEGSVKLP